VGKVPTVVTASRKRSHGAKLRSSCTPSSPNDSSRCSLPSFPSVSSELLTFDLELASSVLPSRIGIEMKGEGRRQEGATALLMT